MKLQFKLSSLFITSFILMQAQPKAIYSIESPLVAETLADVAYRITDADGQPIKDAKGQLIDEKGNVASTFTTDENGQGLFFFVPKMCRYKVQWSAGGNEYTTDFLPVKESGYAWSVDNTSNATYIPFDQKHPYWNPVKKDSYSDIELEQLAKINHSIIKYSKKLDLTPEDPKSHIMKMSGITSPVNYFNIKDTYIINQKLNDIIQGKYKPELKDIESHAHPQDVPENIRIWIERPESMTGNSLRVAIYRGDTKIDEDIADLSKSTLACLCFPLMNIPQGDIEIRLLDNDGQLLASRDAKAIHYMYKKKYADARKTDLDLRLKNGMAYPLIASADWKTPENSGLKICFTPEGGSLITGTRTQIAFSAMTDNGDGVAVDGEVYSSKDSLQTRFASWTSRGGSFFLKPEQGETYYAVINYNGKRYKAMLPESKNEGWSLGVDCLTQLDSKEDTEAATDECLDRLNYWGALWADGQTFDRKDVESNNENPESGRINRSIMFHATQGAYWVDAILNSLGNKNNLVGQYAPKKYVIEATKGGYNLDYPNRNLIEDDIKIRLVNNNPDKDMLEILLVGDKDSVYDSQRIVMFDSEAWLRFPIDGNTPEGHLNIVVKTKEGKELCRRRFNVAHYTRHRDYKTARMHDIDNILGQRRYEPATLIK